MNEAKKLTTDEGKTWRRPPLETAAPKEPAEKCRSCPHLEHDAGQCTGYMQYTDTPSVKCMCLAAKAEPPATAPAEKCGVRRAIERAVEFYGGEDGSRQEGVFNLACLSQALMEQAGLRGAVDGRLCRVILAGRDDVEQFGPSDCYYRLRTSPAPESTKAPEQPAHAAPYPPGKPWERELWVVVVNGDLWLDIGGDPKLYPIRADAEKVAANIGGTVREARPGERAALGEPKEQRPRIDGILSEVETTILTAMRAKAKAEQPAAPAVAMPRLEAWANEMQLMGKINEGHVFFMMGHARADLSAIETKWAGVVEAHLGRIADLETRLKKDAICLAERARQLDEKSQEIWRLNDEVTTLRRAERSTIAERQRAREEKTRIAELEAKLAELQRDYQIARDGWNEAEKKLAAGQGEPLTDREIQDLVYGWKADVRRGDADLLNFAERVAEAQRKKGMAQTANERIYLEGTPVGTKICYLYGGKVRIMGRPAAGSDHNCDEMGCGSAQEHVLQIIDVEQTDANAQAARELAELRAAYRPKDRSRVAAIYVDADKKIEVERLLFGLAGEKAEDGE